MAFSRDEVEQLLIECHRRCCVCHRFCGVKIETDHIVPAYESGDDSIENAIPVCFECHAEVHSYNDQHPRGRKFRPSELQGHKQQWLEICRNRPEALLSAARNSDVGPLQALLDELAFNLGVTKYPDHLMQGCSFYDDQFRRAIGQGSIALLKDDLRSALVEAYVAMGRANHWLDAHARHHPNGDAGAATSNRARAAIQEAALRIQSAQEELLTFLRREDPAG